MMTKTIHSTLAPVSVAASYLVGSAGGGLYVSKRPWLAERDGRGGGGSNVCCQRTLHRWDWVDVEYVLHLEELLVLLLDGIRMG